MKQQVEFDEWSNKTNPFGDKAEDKIMHDNNLLAEMQRLTEENDLGIAYDRVKVEPTGDPFEVLATLEPQDMEKIVVNRGAWKNYNEQLRSRDGFGMVKIILKHGESSDDILKISKNDILNIPRFVREYEPVEKESNQFRKVWRVEENGKRFYFQAKNFWDVDDKKHAVTLYIESNPDLTKPLSKKKSSPGGDRYSERELDTNSKASNNLSIEGPTTAGVPEPRFLDGGLATDNNISPDKLNVNDLQNLKLDDIEAVVDRKTDWTPEQKTDEKKTLSSLREQDSWDNEIIDCIVEFKNK